MFNLEGGRSQRERWGTTASGNEILVVTINTTIAYSEMRLSLKIGRIPTRPYGLKCGVYIKKKQLYVQ